MTKPNRICPRFLSRCCRLQAGSPDYLSILLDLFPTSSSFPPLLGSRQTRSSPRGHLTRPPRGYVPAISLASFSLLLAPFFLASFCLSRKTIHCLPNRKSCIPDLWHTREQAPLSQEVSNPGIVWETRSGPPPSEWSKRRTLPRRAHHSSWKPCFVTVGHCGGSKA